jgi:hypothetical protein
LWIGRPTQALRFIRDNNMMQMDTAPAGAIQRLPCRSAAYLAPPTLTFVV